MPDGRTHRGPNPQDRKLFAPQHHALLRRAVADLAWLETRGYATTAAQKLVGDRYGLDARQRMAVYRSSCSDQALAARSSRRISELRGEVAWIDGFNLLITVEAALSGGLLLVGRDGCLRDVSSLHGSYRKVEETVRAIALVASVVAGLGPRECHWYLDAPVSNSGRLKTLLRAAEFPWQVDTVPNPDRVLVEAPVEVVVVSSDRVVLDRCYRWFNLAAVVLERIPDRWVLDLGT